MIVNELASKFKLQTENMRVLPDRTYVGKVGTTVRIPSKVAPVALRSRSTEDPVVSLVLSVGLILLTNGCRMTEDSAKLLPDDRLHSSRMHKYQKKTTMACHSRTWQPKG